MPVQTSSKASCVFCKHSADAHDPKTGLCVQCGCVRLQLPDPRSREARRRTWVARVEFFVKNRWIAADVRVRAAGRAGAAMKAAQQARVVALKRGTRVAQMRLTLTPVRNGV
jgi:hypothetical protein